MTIASEIQKLDPSTVLTFFQIDATPLGDQIYYFHSGTNELNNDVVWQGNTYSAYPIDASDFNLRSDGTLPRPKMRVANITGIFTALLKQYEDFIGLKVTRLRTMVKFLDAVNFTDGVNPTADPNAYFPDDIYYIDRKSTENRAFVEFELASSIDLSGVKLPRRQIIQNSCQWVYRGEECTYSSGAVADVNDNPTADLEQDRCGKRLSSCKLRFGEDNELPYGGFVGASSY